MRQILLTILPLISIHVWGQQARIVHKIYDGRQLEIIAHGPPYFEFNECDTTLTTKAIQYLDDFAQSYKDSLYGEHKFLIELTPGATAKEREKDNDLGVKRLKAIIAYLERKHGIDKSEFRARYSETITISCVAYLVKEKSPRKLTRRERKRMKYEEDEYFEH